MNPKISIITVNKNDALGLQKTIEGIVQSKTKDIEYIVVDGQSTDNSVSIIKSYEGSIDKWVSEKDTGIYNAMNKGLGLSNGKYVWYINSGDVLHDPNILTLVLSKLDDIDVAYGDIVIDARKRPIILKGPENINFHNQYQHHLPHHPTFICKKQILVEKKGFDENYKITADIDLIMRILYDKNVSTLYLGIPIIKFNTEGISSNEKNKKQIIEERLRIVKKNFPHYELDFKKSYESLNIIERAKQKIKNLIQG